jgi:hypothetical protein
MRDFMADQARLSRLFVGKKGCLEERLIHAYISTEIRVWKKSSGSQQPLH